LFRVRLLSCTSLLRKGCGDKTNRIGAHNFANSAISMLLEVDVRIGPGEPPWDAINYLGGIGDVLESKAKRNLAQPVR
jgi:hypothetical protein